MLAKITTEKFSIDFRCGYHSNENSISFCLKLRITSTPIPNIHISNEKSHLQLLKLNGHHAPSYPQHSTPSLRTSQSKP